MSPSGRSRGVGRDVELDLRVEVVEVDRRRRDAVVERQHGGDRLERAGAAEQVPGHRLGAGDDARRRRARRASRGSSGPRRCRPAGVEVAWALMCTMSAGASSASRERPQDRPGAAAARRVGLGDVVGVGGDAGAEHLGVDPRAAGLGVLLGLEHQHAGALAEHEAVAAGVPRTGDRGRVVVAFFDSAIMLANAAIGSGWIAASVPPATTTSARPSRIRSMRQGDRLVAGGAGRDRRVAPPARAPTSRLTLAAGALGISIGTASGETRRGPFSLQRCRSCRAAW